MNEIETIQFNKDPEKVVEIYLPNHIHPGLGHILLSLSSIVSFCILKDYYPLLNDQNWAYGRWGDFFEPFWDAEESQRVLSLNKPKQQISVHKIYDPGLHFYHYYGIGFTAYAAVQNIYKDYYKKIFKPRACLWQLPADSPIPDVAIHIRSDDHPLQNSLEKCKMKMLPILESIKHDSIFIMTDQKAIVDAFRRELAVKITSLCPDRHDGNPSNLRDKENFKLLLQEAHIATRAKYFIGSAFSQASMIVDIYRDGKNVFYV